MQKDKFMELKSRREHLVRDIKIAERKLNEQVIRDFIDTMKDNELDEFLLFPLTPGGYVPDSWNCPEEDQDFEYDDSDEVVYEHEENIIAESEVNYNTKSYVVITRFGIITDELVYHTTTSEVTNMGDLAIGELAHDDQSEPWHPVSEIIDHPKLRPLLLKCLEEDGMWKYNQEHPECRFLHK